MKHAWVHASAGLICELLLLQVLREPEPEPNHALCGSTRLELGIVAQWIGLEQAPIAIGPN